MGFKFCVVLFQACSSNSRHFEMKTAKYTHFYHDGPPDKIGDKYGLTCSGGRISSKLKEQNSQMCAVENVISVKLLLKLELWMICILYK